jgi:hypothetical protein
VPTIFNIEFYQMVAGRPEPAVLERVNMGSETGNIDTVVERAMSLPRPVGAEGFQIRENNGPARYTVTF